MIDDEDDNLDDFEMPEIKMEDILTNLPEYSTTKLCEIIVCDRYLGINHSFSTACMEELSRRRDNGDTFSFEDYIEEQLNSLPKLEINMPGLRDALVKIISGIKQ
jgi:hypothetical protein